METRANYILVGLFTLAVIAGAFGFVYWFHHIGGTGERAEYRVAFQGPVAGLRTGATVSFNGIRVGEVTAMQLDPNDPKQSLVTVSVEKGTPVRSDTTVSDEPFYGAYLQQTRDPQPMADEVIASMDCDWFVYLSTL